MFLVASFKEAGSVDSLGCPSAFFLSFSFFSSVSLSSSSRTHCGTTRYRRELPFECLVLFSVLLSALLSALLSV